MDENNTLPIFIEPEYLNCLQLVNINNIGEIESTDDFFNKSGLFLLTEYLKEYKDFFKSFIIEYSIYSSSIENFVLTDCLSFGDLNNNLDSYIDVDSIKKRYLPLYNHLKNTREGIYYQKKFFRATEKFVAYIDKENYDENSDYIDEILKNLNEKEISIGKIQEQNIYYSNISFENKFNYDLENFSSIEPEISNKKLHKYYRKCFLKENKKNINSYMISIPILGANINSSNICYEGQGGIFLFLVSEDNNNKEEKLKELSTTISYMIKDITLNNLLYSGMKLAEKSVKNSIKSAIAAIMSRNMSHNIGSHVVNYLIQHICEVLKSLYKTVLNNAQINGIQEQIKNLSLDLDNDNPINISLEELKGKGLENNNWLKTHKFFQDLKNFLKYIKNRMEFFANHSTLDVAWSDDYKLSNIIKNWNDNKILKNYIAESEELNESDIDLNQECVNNKSVSIPDGEIGLHAFFTIIENFIRNSAKHGLKKGDGGSDKLQLKFSIEDYNSELYKIELWDNLGNFKDAFKNIISKKELIKFLEKKNNEKKIMFLKNASNSRENFFEMFNDLNQYNEVEIKKDFIDEQGRLLKSNWGIKEIYIGAAYLRMIDSMEIMKEQEPSILSIGYKKENGEKHLKYIFYMLKPKNLLLVYKNENISEDLKSLNDVNVEELAQKGIDIYEINELRRKIENGEKFRHKFMLPLFDISENDLKQSYSSSKEELEISYLSRLPYRIISNKCKTDIEDLLNHINKTDNRKILLNIYNSYNKKLNGTKFVFSFEDEGSFESLNDIATNKSNELNDENKLKITGKGFIINDNGDKIATLQQHSDFNEKDTSYKRKSNQIMFSITGNNSLKTQLQSIINIDDLMIFIHEISGAAFKKIAIIEETIFGKYHSNNTVLNKFALQYIDIYNYDEKHKKYFKLPVFSENSKNIIRTVERIKFQYQNYKTSDNDKYDFIIIHQGIIDKLIKIENNNTKEKKIDNVIEELKNYGENIIVCSGRGKPEYLHSEVRFLSLGNLINWLDDNKYTLVKGLFSLRS